MSTERLEITRQLAADCQTVFEAWSDPAILREWFFPQPDWSVDVALDFRPGGRYSLRMQAPDGQEFLHHGEYRTIEPPHRLAFTWSSHLVTDTLVTIDLTPSAGGTSLTLVHEFIDTDENRSKHATGWTGCLDTLTRRMANAARQDA